MSEEQYCLNVVLWMDGFSCEECPHEKGSLKCKQICKSVDSMMG